MPQPDKLELTSEPTLTLEQDTLLRKLYRRGGIVEDTDDHHVLHALVRAGWVGKRQPVRRGEHVKCFVTLKGARYCAQGSITMRAPLLEIVEAAHAAHHDPTRPCERNCPLCQVERAEQNETQHG